MRIVDAHNSILRQIIFAVAPYLSKWVNRIVFTLPLVLFLNAGLVAQSLTVTSSNNFSCLNSGITFTATLTPASETGTVQFFNGGLPIGNVGTMVSGTASLTYSGLSQGSNSITAEYSDGVNPPVASPVFVQYINPLPGITISSKTDVLCFSNNTGSITADGINGTSPYSYSIDGISFVTGSTFSNLAAGPYSITVKDDNGCTATQAVSITQPAAINITNIGSTSPVCSGNTLDLSATATGGTGALTYTWSGPNSFTTTGQTPSLSNINITASGTFTVTVEDENNCISTSSITVTVVPLPTAAINYSSASFCTSSAGLQGPVLTGTGAYAGGTYSASPAGLSITANGSINPASSSPGIYTVTYTIPASGGCAQQSTTTSVNIIELPTANISYTGTPFCKTVSTAQPVNLTGTGPYSGGIYSASPAGLSMASNGSINPASSAPGTYTVTYTIPASGECGAVIANTSVTITAIPAAGISYTGSPFCSGQLTANPALTGTGAYTGGIYSSTAGLSLNSGTGQINFTSSIPGTYIVTYTTPATAGCAAAATNTTVIYNAPPVISTNTALDTSTCTNNNITFISAATGSPAPSVQWQLSTNSGGSWSNITGATNPLYSIIGTSPSMDGNMYRAVYTNSCGSTITNTTLLHVGAPINLGAIPVNQSGCNGTGTVSFTSSGNGGNGTLYMSWQYSVDGLIWVDIPGTNTTSSIGNFSTTYTFTPSLSQNGYQFRTKFINNGCAGSFSSAAFLYVLPLPTVFVDPSANQILCNSASTIPVTFTGINATTYTWANDNSAIGLPGSGSGNIAPFIAINNGTTTATATITVTPLNIGGSPTVSCPGAPKTFTIAVHPTPKVNAISNQTYCNGTIAPVTGVSGTVTGSNFTWTNSNTAIGLAASGSGDIPGFTATNTTSSPITATITITPTANGCPGTARTYTVTVYPTASVNMISNQIYCNATAAPLTSFSGPVTGTTFAWTNSNTAIGLPASGSGNLPGFTAVNATSAPVTATITVTPTANGCPGTPSIFIVTVNPTTTVNAIGNQTYCNGTTVPATIVSSNVTGTNFTWANNNTAIGLAASGSGNNIPAFTSANAGNTPITSTITITPTANGCPGTAKTYTITVYPTATVNTIINQTICNGVTVPSTSVSGPVTGTTFTWTNSNTLIGLAASGSGNVPSFSAVNITSAPITANITITPTANGCPGTARVYTITVNPTATVSTISNITYCKGANVPATMLSSPVTGTTFTWSNSNTAIGLAASGSGNLPGFTASNASSVPISATITITPSANGCTGPATTFTVTVYPVTTVTAISNQTFCSGASVPATMVSGPVAGTTFTWTNSNTAIGLSASGSGNIPAFTAINATTAPVTSTITITPVIGGCAGTTRVYTITINPIATVNSISNLVYCNGAVAPVTTVSGPVAGTSFTWANNNTAIGLAASGSGNIPTFTATNATTAPLISTITVTPAASGCAGTPTAFTITVYPITKVNAISNQIYCSGVTATATALAGPVAGTSFTWTNSNFAIGLAASGSGDVPAFTTSNTTNLPVTSTVTIIPSINGCAGTVRAYTITVYPVATANTIGNQTYCSGVNVAATTVTGPVAGTSFTWTNNNTTIGLASGGSGNIPSFNAVNVTNAPITATVTITPTANGCAGTPATFTITVNPIATINVIANQTYCNGTNVPSTTVSGPVAGTTYTWTNSNTAIGLAASGSGTIPTFNAANATSLPITATITITPNINGCAGTPRLFTITVNPTATVTVNSLTKCADAPAATITATPGSGFVTDYNYAWTVPAGATAPGNVYNFATGTAGIYSVIITNKTTLCSSAPASGTITVNPNPSVTVNSATKCASDPAINIIGTPGAGSVTDYSYAWTIPAGATAPGNTSSFTTNTAGTYGVVITDATTLCSSSFATGTVTVNPVITPTFNPVTPVCSGAALAPLPVTSLNGITGNWSPALNNTATTTYTFTPDAGQCAGETTLTVIINPILSATINCGVSTTSSVNFTWAAVPGATAYVASYQVNAGPVVNAGALGNVLSYQVNGLTGGSSVSISVTPVGGAGTCFSSASATCTAIACTPPTAGISYAGPFCSNDAALKSVNLTGTGAYTGGTYSAQAGLTINSVTGAITAGTSTPGTYTVTYSIAASGGCPGITATTPVTIEALATPGFDAVDPICSGTVLAPLPTTALNGIAGTWSPALNNTATTTYTFTPTAGQCATNTILTVTVNPKIIPAFNPVAAICSGAVLAALPITSLNGITGTWSPDLNNTATTTYTFTPDAGECATTTTLTVTVSPNITPTFAAVPAICSGVPAITLPTTSTEGITGSWLPAFNNTATTSYTFTPDAGQCATITTLTVTVNPNITPTFNAVVPVCSGTVLSPLPTTSLNGITGTWLPALNNTATTTYTFTPDAGQCATTATLTVNVNPNITPTFAAIAPVCSGTVLSPLPTTSLNGINGTWLPVLNNTATTTYTFTPDAGQCATTATLTIVVNPNITPTFNPVAAICSGTLLKALPATSLNGIIGTWLPALNNTATTTYTFTPDAGQCATTTTLTVTVNPIITPAFNPVAAICAGALLAPLPATSLNGITGSWSPALDNTTTSTYTFTPDAGQCATTTTLTVTVNPNINPTFNPVAAICAGAVLTALPTTSLNGIAGSWLPALNNTVTTTYTFTPGAGQCATTTTLTITVDPNITPAFNPVAAICAGAALAPLPATSLNGITGLWSPALDNSTTTTYTFTPNGGQCATSTTLTITVNPNITPAFNPVSAICSGTVLAALPTTSLNGITGTWSPALNNAATTTYTFTPDAGQCATSTTLTVSVNPNITPTFAAVPAICSGAAAIILPTTSIEGITGSWLPAFNNTTTTTYTFTPTAGQCAATTILTVTVDQNITPAFNPVAAVCAGTGMLPLPATSLNGITGTWSPALNNTATTTYTFTPDAGQCATVTTLTIAVNQNIIPAFNPVAAICSGAELAALPTTSLNGITGTWSPALNNTATTTYTFTPDAGQCATTTTLTVTVSQNITPTFAAVPAICSGAPAITLPTISTEGITGSWLPAFNNTATASYTFTPDAGQCATITNLTVIVNPNITPTFNAVATICAGAVLAPLPAISLNGITGTWAPALNNTVTTTYTFTPDAGQCATTATLTVTVTPNITPTFNPVEAICSGEVLAPLPMTSLNGISGNWSPALNNTATTTYTFTPSAGQCAMATTLTVTVIPNITPTFNPVAKICSGEVLTALPATSLNGITGTWLPAIDNTTTTTYTFTPNAGQCATTATLTITVDPLLSAIINCGVSTTSSVNFNWATVPGATGYSVSYQVNAGSTVNVGNIGNVLSYQLNGLLGGDRVSITVTPTGSAGTCFTAATATCNAVACTPPTASVSYTGPFCKNNPSVQSVILTGTGNFTGGTYAALEGLALNSANGDIVTSTSVPGTYIVNYTVDASNGCPGVTAATWVTIDAVVTPSFTAVDPICSGAELSPLPTTSLNGITGSWLPNLNNTATTNYTFIPASGQCATVTTLTITVDPDITPVFAVVPPICSGAAIPDLPTTSINGITGSWSPALNNTATTIYTFTPDAGQCATTTTLTVTINPNITPTFNPVAAICSGEVLTALPITSLNGITGTWLPTLNNTATTTYTFAPDAGQCATTTTLTVTVNPNITPIFNPVAAICSGEVLTALPTTSLNGIAGSWSPALNNTATTIYTFIPDAAQCAATTTLTVTVNPNITPAFNPVAAICSGEVLTALSTTSLNGITGSWSPALNNTATTTYTFTPDAGQCATTTTLTVTVNPNIAPTFNPVAPICSGEILAPLPTTSLNGITGSWSPALNNSATTTYTFTPDAGQCAVKTTLTITVSPILSATVNCGMSTTSSVSFNWAAVPGATGYSVSYLVNAGSTINVGNIGNVLSYQISSLAGGDNVSITVTPTGIASSCFTDATSTCTAIACTPPTAGISYSGPFCANDPAIKSVTLTGTGNFTGGVYSAPTGLTIDNSTGDINLNTSSPGTYTVTYTVGASGGCPGVTATTLVTIDALITPIFATVEPICSGAVLAALPITSLNGITGSWSPALNNIATTIYTFTPDAGQCAATATLTITVNPGITPTFNAVAAICSGEILTALPTTSLNGITGTWSPALHNTATTIYTFIPDAGQCAVTTTLTVTVNPNIIPTFNPIDPICSGTVLAPLPTTSLNGIAGIWSPALNNTVTTTYTFTPDAGQCATYATLTVTVNPNITPTFANVDPICSGATLALLPITSLNGITGSWSPALNNTATTTYTFTPDAGQCAATATLTITVNPILSATVNCGVSTTSSVSFNWAAVPGATGYAVSYQVNAGSTVNAGNIGNVLSYQLSSLAGGDNVSITVTPTGITSSCFTDATATCTAIACTPPTASISYAGSFCANDPATKSVTLTGTGNFTGGIYTAPAGLTINNSTGDINIGASIPGTYTVSYTVGASGGCPGVTATTPVTIDAAITPTFATVDPICSGALLAPLPTTSLNVITGTWSPALNNTVTTTYTFTPDLGQCAATTTLTITVNPNIAPTFNPVAAICSGEILTALPTTSLNGITGTWSPALNNTATTTYTFTPDAGQCATITTLTVTVNPNITPAFNPVAAICSGEELAPLPTTALNGITGTWSPALNNTATTTYTFTPDAGQCAATTTLTVTVNPNIAPTFATVDPICSGAVLDPLPTTSLNGITGSWSPALNNIATTTYTFTPDAGQCATNTTLTITVNPNITPTFNPVAAICSGEILAPLPITSLNGIIGSWSPALNNTATTTYTFTPTAGQCAATTTLTITVNPNITPTFAIVDPICSGATLAPLPTTSLNGITGSWSPALNNTATTTYTFIPDAGQCAAAAKLAIAVNPILSATVNCGVSTTSSVSFNWAAVPGATGYSVSYQVNTGSAVNVGNIGNVLSYQLSSLAGGDNVSISVIPIGTNCFSDASATCTAIACTPPTAGISYAGPFCANDPAIKPVTLTGTGNFNGGIYTAPAGLTINNSTGDINLGASIPGSYTVTYTVGASGGCPGVTATASITIDPVITPTFVAAVDPICSGTVLAPLPTTSLNGITGSWSPALNNIATTIYTFTPDAGQCATTTTITITINPNNTPTFNPVASICSGEVLTALPTTSLNGITGTWSPVLNNTATTTYTFTPDAGQCTTSTTLTVIVNPNITPTFNPVATICAGEVLTALPTTSLNGITGSWSPALNNIITTIYTFTPDAAQCATTTTLTVTVNPNITPTFAIADPICSGATLAQLPTTSLNGITGSWSPALNNTATTTYTFTPDAGQCAVTTTLTITVNPILSATVNCGVSTTSSVSFNWAAVPGATGYSVSYQVNTGSAVNVGNIGNILSYEVNGLANSDKVNIIIIPTGSNCFSDAAATCTAIACTPPTASISYSGPFCANDPATKSVTLTGTGNFTGGIYTAPAGLTINNSTGDIKFGASIPGTYTVTYTVGASGGCPGVTATTSVIIDALITPTFPTVGPICSEALLVPLPTTSLNGITGTWAPALNNTATTTYTFTPDAGQCATTTTLSVAVNPNIAPTFNPIDPICSGTVLAPLPTTSLNGITGTWSPALDNTATTTYTFTPDTGQCATTTTLTATVNPNITPTFNPIDQICSGTVLAPLPTTSLNGITGIWSPALNNTATTTYTFTPDAGQCAASTTLTVIVSSIPQEPSLTVVQPTCTNMTGAITITSLTSGMRFSLDGNDFISYPAGGYPGISSGPHTVVAQNTGGCVSAASTVSVNESPVPPSGINTAETNTACGSKNGTITLGFVTGGTAPFYYSVDGSTFTTTLIYTNLAAGSHDITVKDGNGCTFSKTATIGNTGGASITAASSNAYCGIPNGTITATGTGGALPYQYSIDGENFQENNVFTGLAANTYTVTIKDANNCISTTTATIKSIAGPAITATAKTASCGLSNGIITANEISGTASLQYSIDGTTFHNNNVFVNLTAGTFTVTAKDANGCTSSAVVTVGNINGPSVTATSVSTTCGNTNGSITAASSGGTAPIQYAINGSLFQNNNIFSALAAGNYAITAKDANGCIEMTNVTISDIAGPSLKVTSTATTCGKANGSITATATGGKAPIQYSINGITYQGSNHFPALAAGTYTVTVKDANSCTGTAGVTIANTNGLSISASTTATDCKGPNGSISVTASGGTPPLQYSINGTNFQSNTVFSLLDSGVYTVIVKDAGGCIASQPAAIHLINTVTANAGSDITICEGQTKKLQGASNTGNFTWTPSTNLNNTNNLNPEVSPVTTTSYILTATSGVCTVKDTVTVFVNKAPVANAGKDAIICADKNVQLQGSGGTAYQWSPADYLDNPGINNPVAIKPVGIIKYTLSVTDAKGCSSLQKDTVVVTVTAPANVFAGRDTLIVINQPLTLNPADVNNSGFTTYLWSPTYGLNNPFSKNPVAVLDRDITYRVTARTINGCEASDDITIKVFLVAEIYVPKAFVPSGINRLLHAIPVGIKEFRYFRIFNRYGQEVFRTSDPAVGWDGRFNGVAQNSAGFVWVAEGIDYKNNKITRKGNVVLIR